MTAPFHWTYTVEDYPCDRSSERRLTILAFCRRLTIAWSGPLRRHTGEEWDV